jgi:hypothetical protein
MRVGGRKQPSILVGARGLGEEVRIAGMQGAEVRVGGAGCEGGWPSHPEMT